MRMVVILGALGISLCLTGLALAFDVVSLRTFLIETGLPWAALPTVRIHAQLPHDRVQVLELAWALVGAGLLGWTAGWVTRSRWLHRRASGPSVTTGMPAQSRWVNLKRPGLIVVLVLVILALLVQSAVTMLPTTDDAGAGQASGPSSDAPAASGGTSSQDSSGPAANHLTGTAAPEAVATSTTATTACPCSLWSAGLPTVEMDQDTNAVELGVKFRSSTAGHITALRFYRGPDNTGPHVGHLWSNSGDLLAEVTFTTETASGWQQADLATPVAIQANTTYIASYHAPNGRYAQDENYFAASRKTNGPLQALVDGTEGGNGVYRYGPSGGFPTDSYHASNYWVDVIFTTDATAAPEAAPEAATAATPAPTAVATESAAAPRGAGAQAVPTAPPAPTPWVPSPVPTKPQPDGPVLVVGADGYATVQEAVAAAPPGARVRIRAGTYPEQIEVTRPLTLEAYGDGPVWIDGGCSRDSGVIVRADDVSLQGLGIKRTNGASVFVDGTAGTRWARTSLDQLTLQDFNCAGHDGQHFGGFAGFYTGPGVRITNSTITHSVELARPQPGATDCIWFKSTSERPSGGGHYLAGNTITGCRDGIGGESEDDPHGSFDQDTLIEGNRVRACYDDGIQVEGGNRNVVVRGNQIEECGIGIALAPNLVGPLTVEGNVIRSRSVGVYGQLACFKVGDGGQGTAYLTNNECRVTGPDDTTGDGIKQTNSDMSSIVARGNRFQVSRYVYEFTSVPGGSFDGDCLWTSDPNRFVKWGGVKYASHQAFQAGTNQEMRGRQTQDCSWLAQVPGGGQDASSGQ